jgi:ribonuclease HI
LNYIWKLLPGFILWQIWKNPPLGFVKMNFDGASKGNSGLAGYGVVFRSDQGSILHILARNIRHDTNNATELEALIISIQSTSLLGYHTLIVEGDSQIILGLLTHLLHACKNFSELDTSQ